MKYLRIFIAILFLFISAFIPLIYQPRFTYKVIELANSLLTHYLLFYFPIIIIYISAIIFFIYLLKVKDNNLYWSLLFLALAADFGFAFLFDIPNRIIEYLRWRNDPERDLGLKFLYEITTARIFGWIFTFIILTGFIFLFFYFRSKFRRNISICNKI